MRRWVAILGGLLLAVEPAAAQSLTGRVLDGLSGDPVRATRVEVLQDGEAVGIDVSDHNGVFRVRLGRPGTYGVLATAAGYDPLIVDSLRIGAGEDVRVELTLGPQPFDVEGLRVVARRRAATQALDNFCHRLDQYEKTGLGLVMDREALERYEGERATTALIRESLHIKHGTVAHPGPTPAIRQKPASTKSSSRPPKRQRR